MIMGLFSSKLPVEPVTEEIQQRVTEATESITPTTTPNALRKDDRALVHISPFNNGAGYEAAGEFARDLYRPDSTATATTQAIKTMEWWFTDGQLKQRFCTASPHRFDQIVNARYEHSSLHDPDRTFLDLVQDEYVATAQLRLRIDCAFPIRHSSTKPNKLTVDPYTALASALVGPDDTRALVQCAFTPVDGSWYKRGWWGSVRGSTVDDIAEHRKEGTTKGEINPRIVETVRSDRYTAMDMQAQRGQPAFQVAVRVVATAPTKAAVRERMRDLTGAFEEYTYAATEQGFEPTYLSKGLLADGLAQVANRTLVLRGRLKRVLFGRKMVLTADELAGLVHLPNQTINAPLLDWERMKSGEGVPGAREQAPNNTEAATGTAPDTRPSPSWSTTGHLDADEHEQNPTHRQDFNHRQPAEEADHPE